MRKRATQPLDPADLPDTPGAQAEYLVLAFGKGDIDSITKALGTVARARGVNALAKAAGVTRQRLYKTLGEQRDPRLSTLLDVAKALGVRLMAGRSEAAAGPHCTGRRTMP